SGNKRKIGVSLSFHQIEGIATSNGLDYFATNEFFTKQPFLTTQQQLHKFDLRAYLNGYLTSQVLLTQSYLAGKPLKIYPNPVGDRLFIDGDNIAGAAFIIVDTQGKEVFNGKLNSDKNEYNIETLPAGMYFVKMKGRADFSLKLLKK
ncbi:MAG: T9SS type A sorting domain-containing protein, partial [Chryseobacterium sp.]